MDVLSIKIIDKETSAILKRLRKQGLNVSEFVCKAIKSRVKTRHIQ